MCSSCIRSGEEERECAEGTHGSEGRSMSC